MEESNVNFIQDNNDKTIKKVEDFFSQKMSKLEIKELLNGPSGMLLENIIYLNTNSQIIHEEKYLPNKILHLNQNIDYTFNHHINDVLVHEYTHSYFNKFVYNKSINIIIEDFAKKYNFTNKETREIYLGISEGFAYFFTDTIQNHLNVDDTHMPSFENFYGVLKTKTLKNFYEHLTELQKDKKNIQKEIIKTLPYFLEKITQNY